MSGGQALRRPNARIRGRLRNFLSRFPGRGRLSGTIACYDGEQMVIIIMGDAESGRDRVGRLLADYLGWEFADEESLHRDAVSRSSLNDVDCTPSVKALFAALDCLIYEWRDVIVSWSTLEENDRNPHYCQPLVKFVHLTATDPTQDSRLSNLAVKATNSGIAMNRYNVHEPRDRVLAVNSSQRVEQILTTVLSELILK